MNAKTFALLRLLANGEFQSGESLAAELGVSRATIWNLINEAREAGIEVYSVTGRGYRLREAVSLLDGAALVRALGKTARKLDVEVVDEIESTNLTLIKCAAQALDRPTMLVQDRPSVPVQDRPSVPVPCLIAEWQTHGRGRRGRSWFAGIGGALTFSVLWRFEQGAAHLSALSLAVGVALVRAIDELGAPSVMLKWPNDLIHHHHKLAGVLIELEGDVLGPAAAVIGIGVNVRLAEPLRAKVDQAATDLETILSAPVDRNVACATLLRHLVVVLERYAEDGFAPFAEEWSARHAYQGREVWLLLPNGERQSGYVDGVAPDGSLLLSVQGKQKRYTVGEISIRAAAR